MVKVGVGGGIVLKLDVKVITCDVWIGRFL